MPLPKPPAEAFIEGERAAPPPEATAEPEPKRKDAIGRAKEALVKEPPLGAKTMFGETDMPGRVVRAAGDLFLPETWGQAARQAATLPIGGPAARAGATGVRAFAQNALSGGWLTAPLKRIGAGAAAGAVTDTISRGYTGAADFASRLLTHGGEQAVGEVLPGALNFGLTQRAARPALKALTPEAEAARKTADEARGVKAREEHEGNARRIRQEHDRLVKTREAQHAEAEAAGKAEHAAGVATAKEQHATQIREYEQTGAKSIVDAYKAQVPAFREFESSERGLLGIVFGKGPQKMSARYDEVMRDIARDGKGRAVEIPLKDSRALGLKPRSVREEQDRGYSMATVDAAQLAESATGFWKKDHGVYRRAVHALDGLGLGNPEARAEYKAGMALIDFAVKSKMLKGEKFNPQRAREAFTDIKALDQIRKRGQGDIFEGPIADAVRRPRPELALPAAPAAIPPPRPLAKPLVPPFRAPEPTPAPTPPPGVEIKRLPKMGFTAGAAVAEIPFIVSRLITGHFNPFLGGAGVAGGLAARALSERPVAMRAPLSPGARAATRVLPQAMGQEAASLLGDEP